RHRLFRADHPSSEGRREEMIRPNPLFTFGIIRLFVAGSLPGPVLFLLPALLCSAAISIQADEKSSETSPNRPIPIATIKRSTPVDFDKEILPILENNCLACHNRTTAKARLILETPQDILKGGESGPAVVAKRSSSSLL